MEVMNKVKKVVYENTVVETKQGLYIQEMLYKKIKNDTYMTCVKVMYIPQGGNRNRYGRGPRAIQSTVTTIQSGQTRFMQATESTVPPSDEAALIQAMQNLSIRPQNTRGPRRQGQPRNPRPEFTASSRSRQGAIPRQNNAKFMRTSKTTMIKDGARTTVSSMQTAMYQSGGNTTVRTGEAVVTRDMRAPPGFRTSVVTNGSEFTWTAPPAWRK